MDRVGGYLAFSELLEDARAFDDVILLMAAEADAGKIRKLEGGRGQ